MSDNTEPDVITGTHVPTMNLRFYFKGGRFVLQQMHVPINWGTPGKEWRDVELANPEDVPK